ncbi:MAG: hypothetical protein FWF56_01115 [Firmicutes bacterium]|nr:hypothetical protein [Bacillota bacterium]MCL1954057.1 hypothetical protein [Bacillota bacterium]
MKIVKANAKIYVIAKIVLCSVIVVCLLVSLGWRDDINLALRLKRKFTKSVALDHQSAVVVHTLSVGQGDATIIQLPQNKTVLIDTGTTESIGELLNYIHYNLVLKSNFKYFDYIILTTALIGRVGGMSEIALRYVSRDTTIFRPNIAAINPNDPLYSDPGLPQMMANSYITHSSISYRKAINAIYNTVATVVVNQLTPQYIAQEYKTEMGVSIQALLSIFPFADRTLLGTNFVVGNSSPIIILEFGDKSWIFSGAANSVVEDLFVQRYGLSFGGNLKVSVIMIGNNGGKNSMSLEYLEFLIDVVYSYNVVLLLSMSIDNSHTYPDREMLNRLDSVGLDIKNIHNTALQGDIVTTVILNGDELILQTITPHILFDNSRPYLLWWEEILCFSIGILLSFIVIVYNKNSL